MVAPAVQFLGLVVVVLVVQVVLWCVQFLDKVVDMPLLSTTVEVVDVPAAVHRQGVDVPAVMQ